MTPLVLLPGMMCDARLFAPQIAALSGRHTVHCAPIGGQDTVTGIAQEVLENAPPQFALAGLSMGGIVAMEILRLAATRVTKIALMDTNALAETDAVRARRQPQITAAQNGDLARVMRDEMKPNYLTAGPNRSAILDLCMDMANTLGPDVFIRQSRALATRPDQTETLKDANIPALILCGRDDALCPVSRHTYMHGLMPHATLKIIENAGHLPCLEQPDQTTEALAHWLAA